MLKDIIPSFVSVNKQFLIVSKVERECIQVSQLRMLNTGEITDNFN